MENVKSKLPWLSVLFCVLICLKIFNGLGYVLQSSGLIAILLWLELILMAWVALTLVLRECLPKKAIQLIIIISIIVVIDLSIFSISTNGLRIPFNIYAQLLGAELTYALTIAYCLLSKKFKAFKAAD